MSLDTASSFLGTQRLLPKADNLTILPDLLLRHTGHLLEVLQRSNILGFDPGLAPFFSVKRRVLVGVCQLRLELGQDDPLLSFAGIHCFQFSVPEGLIRRRKVDGSYTGAHCIFMLFTSRDD
jgi:hypothetical protein